jgi:hypothetical protein
MDTSHLADLRKEIQALGNQPPFPPWREIGTYAIGGLLFVGYEENSDLLLVVSSQGRGVFDCITGTLVARDRVSPEYEDDAWLDRVRLMSLGIGPLEDKLIRLAGIDGGGLPHTTEDGWRLSLIVPEWPDTRVLLSMPYIAIYGTLVGTVQIASEYEVRAYGFSDTGESFVVATPSDIMICNRAKRI